MISAGLRVQGVPVVERELTQLHKKFGSFYAANVAVKSRAFEHVPELLGTLKVRGAKLAVCTNKLEGLSKALLNALDLGQYFDFIAGRDTFEESKPNPAHLTKTILATGGSLQRAVYVGDSDVDIITARDAQVPCIAVSFGYTPVPVRQLAPDVVIDHYSEFISALEGLLRSPRLLPMRACNLP